jgi:hypothetical protein
MYTLRSALVSVTPPLLLPVSNLYVKSRELSGQKKIERAFFLSFRRVTRLLFLYPFSHAILSESANAFFQARPPSAHTPLFSPLRGSSSRSTAGDRAKHLFSPPRPSVRHCCISTCAATFRRRRSCTAAVAPPPPRRRYMT